MLFPNTSILCPSPPYIALDGFDFDSDFDDMSRTSSSSPSNEHERGSSNTSPPSTTNEALFPTHMHESPYPDDRSSLSGALRSYLEDGNESKPVGGVARSHLQVSPYNYSVHPESTLITPASISASSPPITSNALAVRHRSQTPIYQPYSNHYAVVSNPSRTSAAEETGYPPYYPTGYANDPHREPYWGSYNVSAPPSTSPPMRQRSVPVLIAPQPSRSSNPSKRKTEEGLSYVDSERSRKRPYRGRNSTLTRRMYPVVRRTSEVNEEERFLMYLKEEAKLPWKDITQRWAQETGHPKQEAALQMQYKRLKERIRVWTPGDVSKPACPSCSLKFLLVSFASILANYYSSSWHSQKQ